MIQSCCDKLLLLCKKLDFFGFVFHFRVNKDYTFGSSLGGIIFIVYMIIAVFFVVESFIEFLTSAKMNIVVIDRSINPSPSLNLTKNNFAYAMRITFDNDTSLENTEVSDLFLFETNYVIKYPNTKTKVKIDSRPCTLPDFKERSSDELFQKRSISDFTCFEISPNMSLYGIYTDSEMAYIEYLVYLNETVFRTNYQRIKDVFNKFQFKLTLYYIETRVDVSNITHPIFYKVEAIYTYLDLFVLKRVNINFQELIFQEDKDLFLEDYKNYTYMPKFSSEDTMVTVSNRETAEVEDKLNLLKYFLRAVNYRKTIKRGFQKIPEFLAILGGLLANLIIGLGVVIALYNEFIAKQFILNKTCKYTEALKESSLDSLKYIVADNPAFRKNKSLVSNKSIIFPFPPVKLNESSTSKTKDFEMVDLTQNLSERLSPVEIRASTREKELLLDEQKNHLLLSIKDVILYYLCCKDELNKNKASELAESKFNYYLDVITYINKMEEIDILKYLLLDDDNVTLFNFISRPNIKIENVEELMELKKTAQFFVRNSLNNVGNSDVTPDSLKSSYNTVLFKETKTKIDEKILKLFEAQLTEIIN